MKFGLILLLAALSLAGCRGKSAQASVPKPTPKALPSAFKEWPVETVSAWPADTIPKPSLAGSLDHVASAQLSDGVQRLPSVYKAPEWAKVQPNQITMTSDSGAKLTYHLLPRTAKFVKDENMRLKELIDGKTREKEQLVVARPWLGWSGQAVGETESGKYVVQIYHLFTPEAYLNISVEWPFGQKEAADQAQELLRYVVHTVRPQ